MTPTTQAAEAPFVAASPALRAEWRGYALRRTGALLLPVVAGGILLAIVARSWPLPGWAAGGAGVLLVAFVILRLRRYWQSSLVPVTQRLDRQFPELEDSTGLLLREPSAFNLLESIQQQRVSRRLQELRDTKKTLLPVNHRPALGWAGLLLLLAGAAWWLRPTAQTTVATTAPAVALNFPEEKINPAAQAAPRVIDTRINVTPPAYTRQPATTAAMASFRCPSGSKVRWTVRVNRATDAPPQLELGQRRVVFRAVAGQANTFVAEQTLTASVLYRVRFAGKPSDDYAIEVQPDQAPVLQIQNPKPYTLIEFGDKPQLAVRIALRDDYGLSRARLVATVAQGQGEAVKFTEVVTDLSGPLRGQPTQATATHLLSLPKLGLTYGDEVYFYVQAWDNARGSTRSDTYLVQWEDTALVDGTSDLSLGVNVVPAYFRSQRQIIIDTEKLIAEQSRLTATTVAERGNNLGFDQKILRMRYGKFLGEEFEQGIGETATRPPVEKKVEDNPATAEQEESKEEEVHSADDGHDHSGDKFPAATDVPGQAATAALMEPYMHLHDDSETADFLEPAVKAKLRGVLAQMWEAELRLRTSRLKEALPYEYRALRLLKQVQQQTRAYVKKSGFTPPVLPEATLRLTGEMGNAAAPRREQKIAPQPAQPAVRDALRWLGAARRGQAVKPNDALVLERAGQAISQAALQRPGAYLAALRDLRGLVADVRAGRPLRPELMPSVERALTGLLPAPPAAPVRPPGANPLAQRYFQELSR
ncbi:membrane-anchored conserved hypothetical protein [Hymenobacter roseosalivarius DSM 11622]|uniref:DUF4175 domain-containing protein n=1 Tax=Hymenobacter roseosalivarius DSM 11622 TaxID=645990 RepID=A0A1W1VKT1_9BACT|nr:DUF4175 family protein [Hymenobacter roseosalivarius]SMB93995.1 membrane-anchored conserved hypothetical protein [Hymenobacter roseosalivarius DSM 11622]